MDDELVNKLLRFRRGLDGEWGTHDDQSFASLGGAAQQLNSFEALTPKETAQLTDLVAQNRLKVSSSVFRIHSRGTVRDGKVIRFVEGVVQRDTGSKGPLSILAWKEN